MDRFRPVRASVSASVAAFAFVSPIRAASVDALVKPFREVSVSAPVSGIIESVQVREGDTVQRGQILAQLENEVERVEVERLAKILEKRQYDDAGTARLFKNNVVSEDEAVEKRIEREIAELQHRRAMVELERKTLHAPLAGTIVAVNFDVGEWVDPGVVVFEIVDIDQVYAEVLVTPEQGLAVAPEAKVTVQFPLLGDQGRFAGTVDFIDPRVDASSSLMRIRVVIPNADHRLRPGYRGTVELP
jgi:RND family efflux transporter MFP subunit